MKPIQRIMVRTEVVGQRLAARRVIEHPAQHHPVHHTLVHAETHDAPCPVVHHDEHPVRVQHGRFAPKQIHTPQTVLRVTPDGQPGRPRRVWFRPVPNRENAAHHILVDGNPKGQSDLLRDPWTSLGEARISEVNLELWPSLRQRPRLLARAAGAVAHVRGRGLVDAARPAAL